MKRSRAFVACAFVVCSACKSNADKSDDKGEPSNQTEGEAEGDDLSVDVLVPMGLWDPNVYTKAIETIPQTLSGQAEGDVVENQRVDLATMQFIPDDTGAFYESSALGTPSKLVAGMKDLLRVLRSVMSQMFAKDGIYKGTDITIRAKGGQGKLTFEVSETKEEFVALNPSYHVLTYDEGNQDYPFAIEVWVRTAEGLDDFVLGTKWLFKVAPSINALDVKAIIQTAAINDTFIYGEIVHAAGKKTIEIKLGGGPQLPGEGRAMQLRYDYTESVATVSGAYALTGPDAPIGGVNPRYRDVTTGDINLFRIYSDSTVSKDAIQELGFLPIESRPTPPLFDNSVYTTFEYLAPGMQYVARLIQDPKVHAGCASATAAFKTKLTGAGKTVPASLNAAPASLCSGSQTQAQIIDIVWDICMEALSEEGSFELELTIDGKPQTIDFCAEAALTANLANPQRMFVDEEGTLMAQAWDATPPSFTAFRDRGPEGPEQAALYASLLKFPFAPYDFVLNPQIPAVEHRQAASFVVDSKLTVE